MKQERLTRKVCSMYDDSFEYCCNKMADKFDGGELIRANQKLGQLEDIEEELGIDLITFFKYLSAEKVFFIDDFGKIQIAIVRAITKEGLQVFQEGFYWGECDFTLPFKEYGKTWALTEGELK